MTQLSSDDIKSSVQAGILTEPQAASMQAHIQSRQGYRDAMPKDDEPFEFFRGFAEIFVTIGLTMLVIGVVGMLVVTGEFTNGGTVFSGDSFGAFVGLLICLFLARYYTIKRRMSLPSIALATGAALFAAMLGYSLLWPDQPSDNGLYTNGGKEVHLAVSFLALLFKLGYYRIFKLPFSMFLAGIFGMIFIYAVTFYFSDVDLAFNEFPESLFDLGRSTSLAFSSLIFGLAAMVAGLWFDMKDPHRLSRYSATGFWLHILAAPALVNTCAMSLYNIGGTLGYLLTALLLCMVTLFAIVIDRRSFLTAGLFYFLAILVWAVTESFGEDIGTALVIFIIGSFFTIIGTWWVQIRAVIMRALPAFPGKQNLPPYNSA